MSVIQFPTNNQAIPEEPEFMFSMEVYSNPEGGYTYEISAYEDEELDDELMAAILYRASNELHPFEVEIELDLEDDL